MMSSKDSGAMRSVARPLQNLGSTCFVNCVLQALAHAPELCLAMDTESHSYTCPIAEENSAKRRASPSSSPDESGKEARRLSTTTGTRRSKRSGGGRKSPSSDDGNFFDFRYCALCELEHHIRSVHDSTQKDKPLAPSTFVNGFIEHVAPWFKLGVQEDAHEFLRLLIDAMQKSCQYARVQGNPQDDEGDKITDQQQQQPQEQQPPVPVVTTDSKEDNEYPFSLFRGMVESKVYCSACQASSATLDPIEDIGLEVSLESVPLQSNDRPSRNSSPTPAPALADVQSAFQRFAREECLDGYKCETCGSFGRATKQTRLASIPPILTLHLKRFRYGDSRVPAASTVTSSRRSGRSEVNQLMSGNTQDYLLGGKSGSAKIEGHIKFDVFFDLKPYLTPELQANHKAMFCRLFAVIVHAGKNSHSGHYIAYVQSLEKNEWWKMDDGRVTLAHRDDVMQAEAYMLFYRVLQHPLTASLEESYKRKLESNSCNIDVNDGGVGSNSKADPIKRRRSEGFLSGEDWARAKAPRLVGALSHAQEMVAEAIQLSSDCLKRIDEEASKDGATIGKGPSTALVLREGDVVGGTDHIRRQLCELFYRLAKHFDDGKVNTTSTKVSFFESNFNNNTNDNNSSSNNNNKAPAKVVEPKPGVVEPEEATDVL